jgi:hypothetical protein
MSGLNFHDTVMGRRFFDEHWRLIMALTKATLISNWWNKCEVKALLCVKCGETRSVKYQITVGDETFPETFCNRCIINAISERKRRNADTALE